MSPLMDPLATILYDALRPRFIQLHHLDELCELVDILVHEVNSILHDAFGLCLIKFCSLNKVSKFWSKSGGGNLAICICNNSMASAVPSL